MAKANLQTATNGSVRVPFDQRDGATSDVFFTRVFHLKACAVRLPKSPRGLAARLPSSCTLAKKTAPTSFLSVG